MTRMSLAELRADLARSLDDGERPAWLDVALGDPAAFWEQRAPELIAAAPGPSGSAVFEWYSLFHEFGQRHAFGRRAAFCEYSPAGGFRDTSFADIVERARRVAGAWRARGLGPETSLCIVLEPSPTYMTCVLAAWCCGASITLIPPDGPSFVRRALDACGVAAAQAAPGAGATPPPTAFVVTGTKARPWLEGTDPACLLHWEVAPNVEPLLSPYRYPAASIAAKLFSPIGDDWDHPVELSAEQLYLSALRDGLLAFDLRPGQTLAAPGFSEVQYKPALLFMTFAVGATWVELDNAELADGRMLLDGRVQVLGVTAGTRDLLLKSPLLSKAKFVRWFRNVAEDIDLAPWSAFETELDATGVLGMNWFANSAAGGSILFSAWSPRPSTVGVWISPGLPCQLGEPNGTGMPPLGDVTLLEPLDAPKDLPGVRAGLPASALGRLVIANTGAANLWVANLGSHRSGVYLPERQIERLLKAAHPDRVRAAVLVAIPMRHQAGRPRVVLLVFSRPSAETPALERRILPQLKAELGAERVPDRLEVFELNPKLVDPKAPEPEIDRVGCAAQYISGTLWGKRRCRTFRELAALSVEVAQIREYQELLEASPGGG